MSDFAVGAPKAGDLAGEIHVFSGATQERLYSLHGVRQQFLGSHIAPVGDQDGDGVTDFLAGSFRHHASIRSGKDGAFVGCALPLVVAEPAGDVDRDGTIDLVGVVSWTYPGDASGPDEALVVSGATREILLRLPLPERAGKVFAFGRAGDLDRDGFGDLFVTVDPVLDWNGSRRWEPAFGEVRMHSGRDARLLRVIDRTALVLALAAPHEVVVLAPGRGED